MVKEIGFWIMLLAAVIAIGNALIGVSSNRRNKH